MSLLLHPRILRTPEEIEASKTGYFPGEEVLVQVLTESGWVYVPGKVAKRFGKYLYHVKVPGIDRIYDMVISSINLKKYKPGQTS
jgi:hypothetical protein